jgi:CRISPR/Cas system-associated exonuclease Cas4 (RecB family)
MTRWTGAFIRAQGIAGKGLHLPEAAILAKHSRLGTLPANATRGQRLAAAGKVGVIEGAIGAAVVEPIVFSYARGLQDDYTLQDSAFNIMFGAALGGALHIGGTAITGRVAGIPERAELFKRERKTTPIAQTDQTGVGPLLTNETTIETREAAFRAAAVQTLEGRPVDVEDILRSEREILEYKRGKDEGFQRANVIAEKRQQLDAEVTRLKRKLKPGQAIEDADLAARSAEIEARIREVGDRPALPALAKERARLAQEFNDIRDLRIAIKQMETIQRGGELPKVLRNEIDDAVETRMNQALTTEQVNQLAIDKINAADQRAKQPPISNFDFKVMERESQRATKQTTAEAIDAEARTVEADDEFTALVEDAEAVDIKLDDAAIKQIDEAVEKVKRVNDAARAFAKCRAV